jgi:YcaO-like protein with predicted kinase domain
MTESLRISSFDSEQIPSSDFRQTCNSNAHRRFDPATTLERVRPLFREIGLTRIANVTGLDRVGIPVVSVCRPNARSNAVCQGKGLTLDAAKASGVMESIETYCAENIMRPVIHASARELARRQPIADIEKLCRISGSSLSADTKLMWIEGQNIVSGAPCFLPFELVHADFTVPRPPGSGNFLPSTNGLASGNTMSEAILHGVCEVIERDAVTLCTLGRKPELAQRIDLETIDDQNFCSLIMKLDDAGLTTAVWDITSDIGVAAFRCQIIERETGSNAIILPAEGYGCHPNRSVALARALTEAAQARVTAISAARDDMGANIYGLADDSSLVEHWRQTLSTKKGRRQFQCIPNAILETTESELAHVMSQLAAAGFEDVIKVDISPFSAELCAVARTVIPGLEGPMHRFYLPGPRGRDMIRLAR